jgi:hypothetical protein
MNSTEDKINAIFILEVLGRPPEHITKTLGELAERMGEEKDIKVLNKKIHEPTPLKNKKDFFTNFAEIEVETNNILKLAMLVFKYMPAHLEILHPENLDLTNNQVSEVFNELTRRLHGYDEVARIVTVEKKLLEKKLKSLLEKEKVPEKDKEAEKEK